MHLFKPKYKIASGEYRESKRWAVKFVRDGKQIVKSTGTPNKAAATARAKEIIRAVDEKGWDVVRPKLPGARKTKIEDVLEFYREYGKEHDLGVRTIQLNVASVRRLARELKIENVEDLTGTFSQWKRKNPRMKATTVNAILRAAKSVFKADCLKHYADEGISVVDPFKDDKQKRAKIEPFAGYPREFIIELVEAARKELKPNDLPAYRLFLLSLYAGTRQQEALWAKWDDLAERGIMITSTEEHRNKARKPRFVPLSPEVVKELNDCRNSPHAFIIPPERIYVGKTATRRGRAVATRLCTWLRVNGIDVEKPIHELRKICGSLIATDHGLYAAKEMLGHSSVAITEGFYAALLERPVVRIGV